MYASLPYQSKLNEMERNKKQDRIEHFYKLKRMFAPVASSWKDRATEQPPDIRDGFLGPNLSHKTRPHCISPYHKI